MSTKTGAIQFDYGEPMQYGHCCHSNASRQVSPLLTVGWSMASAMLDESPLPAEK